MVKSREWPKAYVMSSRSLLNSDLLATGGSRLGDDNGENAILQASFDSILVDARGEAESALELADRTLVSPVAVVRLSSLLLLNLLRIGGLVFNGGLVVRGSLSLRLVVVFTLDAALHDQGLVVGEFNVDVLLGNTRELAIEVVSFIGLADIEAGVERGSSARAAGAVGVIVVKKTEEGREVTLTREASTEERHC